MDDLVCVGKKKSNATGECFTVENYGAIRLNARRESCNIFFIEARTRPFFVIAPSVVALRPKCIRNFSSSFFPVTAKVEKEEESPAALRFDDTHLKTDEVRR